MRVSGDVMVSPPSMTMHWPVRKDAASFLTGQCIVIDGGLTITSPLSRMEDGA
ncbi:MAG TPA: hypothetical protein VKJ67_05595 [Methylomirabilota bacterium]|nr:hypothetical protein [Methylomirabilota bacterium]